VRTFCQTPASAAQRIGGMSRSTPATRRLQALGLSYDTVEYDYDSSAGALGEAAAAAIGEPPARVLKTLMAEVDGKPVCVVLPVAAQVNMKKLAALAGGKSARLLPGAQAERLTGFKVGGISPFGQKHAVPTWLERSALAQPYLLVNGGQRGLLLKLAADDLLRGLGGASAELVA
jgi:Cys-tRNA(Pro)/Cys-tRNA(Cys) deacylase